MKWKHHLKKFKNLINEIFSFSSSLTNKKKNMEEKN